MRSGDWRVSSAGSVPPISRCPGVQAQYDGGSFEDPLDLGTGLDHGPDVRVEHCAHTVFGRQVGDAVQVVQQLLPAVVVKDRPGVVSVEPGHR